MMSHINLKMHLERIFILDYLEYNERRIYHTPKWKKKKKKKGLTRLKSFPTMKGFPAFFTSIIIRHFLNQPSPASCPQWWSTFCSMIQSPTVLITSNGGREWTDTAISQGMKECKHCRKPPEAGGKNGTVSSSKPPEEINNSNTRF